MNILNNVIIKYSYEYINSINNYSYNSIYTI